MLTQEFNLPNLYGCQENREKVSPPASEKAEVIAKPAPKKAAKNAKKVAVEAATISPAATAAPKKTAKPSLDVIARAAYLNYRRRVEQGLPGDSHGDWLEAERQSGKAV